MMLKTNEETLLSREVKGGTSGNSLDDRNVLYLDCGSGYTGVYVFQKSLNLAKASDIL